MAKKINPITKIFHGPIAFLLLLLIAVTAFSGCLASGAKEGDTVLVYYILTLENGEVVDSNVGGQPLAVVLGQPGFIPGFEKALYGMTVNQTKKVVLQPEEAYGFYDPANVISVDIMIFLENLGFVPNVDDYIPGLGTITEVTEDTVVIDYNHELVGQVLTFEITVSDIQKSEAP
jgi:FKBP-type peptidyl-prolyl cis-trans isomerases 2